MGNYYGATHLPRVCIVLAMLVLCAVAPPPRADASASSGKSWSFAVIGDTRDVTKASTTGISPVLPELARQIASETTPLDFVIHCGDLTNGYWLKPSSSLGKLKGHARYRAMFANFLAATAPIREAGIPMYYVRGNHEFGGEVHPGTGVPTLIRAYAEMFAAGMPQNGPEDSKGLNYSFVHKSANFIVTDQYTGSQGTNVSINNSWITSQLSENTSPILFAFGHSPAFSTSTTEEYEFQLSAVLPARDTFWDALVQHKAKAFICCHEHFYARGFVSGVCQIVQGNGGATPMTFDPKQQDPRLENVFPNTRVPAKDMLPGYLVVTIHEDTNTVTVTEKCIKDGVIVQLDTFTLP